MRVPATALATLIFIAGCAREQPAFSIYLFRHAEKTAEAQDPELTAAGQARAQRLGEWLSVRGIRDIWSSDYRRTRQTAAPLALALGEPVRLYDPRQPEAFARELRSRGRTAAVSGHSNTTPGLAAALCGCTVPAMDEAEYERLLVVRFEAEQATITTLDQRALE